MTRDYDIVAIGGGIAGASFGKCMAEAGARALIVEAETQFRDRVRGEVLVPWGVAEAQALEIYETLRQAGPSELLWENQYIGRQQTLHRDVLATTLTKTPIISCFHPSMQAALLSAAEGAGAEVCRGTMVREVSPGDPPHVVLRSNSTTQTITARLIVVADGRNSRFRGVVGTMSREEQSLCTAGVLVDNVPLPEDEIHLFINPAVGELIIWSPQRENRARVYLCF